MFKRIRRHADRAVVIGSGTGVTFGVIVDVGGEALDGGEAYVVVVAGRRRTGWRRAYAAFAIAHPLSIGGAGDQLVVRKFPRHGWVVGSLSRPKSPLKYLEYYPHGIKNCPFDLRNFAGTFGR
jgi:hypothetical protein